MSDHTSIGSGRGRGRGRGGGRGLEDPEELVEARAQNTITKRRLAAMPAAVREELVTRKRTAGLQRVLLPDAPPRKRATRKLSPSTETCTMVEPQPLAPTPSTSRAACGAVPRFREYNAGSGSLRRFALMRSSHPK